MERTSSLPKPAADLQEAVAALQKTIAGYGGQLGVSILDVPSGELLAARGDLQLFNPASNAKLLTAAAALVTLHGNYRFETGLYGERKGNAALHLVLRGRADPSLQTQDLWEMARELRNSGIRRVEGDIVVDQRFFDEAYVPPGFEQQPGEWAYFRAPVSAVALDENTVRMTVRPSSAGAPATVSFDPPGFVDIEGTVKTLPEGHPQSVTLELSPSGMRLAAKVGGGIPEKVHAMSFTRRVDNPMLVAGYALKAALNACGIEASGGIQQGGEGAKSILALHRSAPLSELLAELGKQSNNFYAEMIFKTLGAEKKGRGGTSEAGAEVVRKFLTTLGPIEEGTVIKNGSGLFDSNRVSPSLLVRLLRYAYRSSAIGNEFVAQLAVGGVDGTLHGRFRDHKQDRVVRAKTGTLESAMALSGYAMGPPGRGPIAFSILVNHVAGKVSGARAATDKCVEAIIRHLWRSGGT